MRKEIKEISIALEERGFRVKYEARKFRYSISKLGNPLERLCLQEEALLDRDVDDIINEYDRMLNFFNEREIFLANIKDKSIHELTFEEFRRIHSEGIPHKAVDNAYKKFWKPLDSKAKNHIRNEYDEVAEYVYSKAIL